MSETIEVTKPILSNKLETPVFWQIYVLNDDNVSFDTAYKTLLSVFRYDGNKTADLVDIIHEHGEACCGTFTKDLCESLASKVKKVSTELGQTLSCRLQKC